MSNALLPVAFRDTTLSLIAHNGEPYAALRPIAEGMGLDWAGQFTKIQRNAQRWGVEEISIPSKGGPQHSTCLPLRKLAGWLMTLHPNKVKPELREKVLAFQNECDDVLWAHWKSLQREQTTPPPSLLTRRWLISYDATGKEIVQAVPNDACVMSLPQALQLLTDPDGPQIDTQLLADFIGAASQKLARRCAWHQAKSVAKPVKAAA